MISIEQHDEIQRRELEWWTNTNFDPRMSWWHYDRVLLPYLDKDMGTVADVGCGPVPYFCNHNVQYQFAFAVDPLMDDYLKLSRYDVYRSANVFGSTWSTGTLRIQSLDSVFLLNALDHVADPAFMLAEMARILKPNGKFLLYVDIEKEPDAMHPHLITRKWLREELGLYFKERFCQVNQSWKFSNPVFWYVGRRKE